MADQGTEGVLSPWLRKHRINASKPFLKGRVLDYGCGSGALADLIESNRYLGVEIDQTSLNNAKANHPKHTFSRDVANDIEKFDTVVSLAVIEHVTEPSDFLTTLASYLNTSDEGKIVITTPHPSLDWAHDLGANFGLFSKHANEEHEELLDKTKLQLAGDKASLELIHYNRFLYGANQIAIFKKK